MLASVFISYFKTYKGNTYLPVSKGEMFTSIIGENGVGKSSILEAVDCLINRADWNVNNQAKKSGSSPHIVGCFLVPRNEVPNKRKGEKIVFEIYRLIDEFLRSVSVEKFNPSQRPVVEGFVKHRDEIIDNCDDVFICLAGRQFEVEAAFFTVFDKQISMLFKNQLEVSGISREDSESQAEKYLNVYVENVISHYSYIYVPAEVDVGDFTRLESSGIQRLMGKDINDKIDEHLTQKHISEINVGLSKFVDEIGDSLSDYRYKRLPGKDGYLNRKDVREKVIEAFFSTRVLNKTSSQGDVPIRSLSSGEKRAALIDLALSFVKQDENRSSQIIIAFDEPEASLHVGACFDQYAKIDEISKSDCQTLVATHWYGFMPIVSKGTALHICNKGDMEVNSIPLYNYKEDLKQKLSSQSGFPSDIDLKSMNDLVQSIFHSLKKDNYYSWIICEGSTDKIYLEYYLEDYMDRIKIIPLGGAKVVKKLFEYLCIPLSEVRDDIKDKGKVLCLIDTDNERVEFEKDILKGVLEAKRYYQHNDVVELVRVNDKRSGQVLVVEDVLEGHLFDKVLRSFREDYQELDVLFSDLAVDDLGKCSSRIYDLRKSQEGIIQDFFRKDGVKMEFCKRYTAMDSVKKPSWIQTIEEYFGFDKQVTTDVVGTPRKKISFRK